MIAQRAASLGHPTVAVSGNHDSPLVMRRLAANGAIVLTHDGRLRPNGRVRGPAVQRIDGMLVAGYEDPLESQADRYGHRLDFTDRELRSQELTVEAWFDTLSPRPQIVLVHDFRIAAALRDYVGSKSDEPLIILTGHDHRSTSTAPPTWSRSTAARSAPAACSTSERRWPGSPRCTWMRAGWPQAVDLIAADPISGDATAQRVRLVEQQTGRPPPATAGSPAAPASRAASRPRSLDTRGHPGLGWTRGVIGKVPSSSDVGVLR